MTAQKVSRVYFEIEADYRLHNPDNGTSTAITGRQKVDFKLGLGPCKRWVTELSIEVTISTLVITQVSRSEDPEVRLEAYRAAWDEIRKAHPDDKPALKDKLHGMEIESVKDRKVETFIYKWDDVRGRVRAE